MKKLKGKLIILFGIFLAVFYMSSDFALIDIEKTAIIVALGIDKIDNNYEITAQIGIPQATDQTSANNDAVISSTGSTIIEGITNLGIDTGWHPKLSFCNLIIFGNSLIQENISPIINHLLSSEKIQNSATLCLSEDSAKELLMATTPLDAISSFAIQKILLQTNWTGDTVTNVNIKDFALSTYSESNYGLLPIISIIKGDNKGKEGGSSSMMTSKVCPILASSQDSQSGDSQGDDATIIFDGKKTGIFSNCNYMFALDKNETLIYNLLYKNSTNVMIDLDDENATLEVTFYKHNIYLTNDEKPKLSINLDLTTRLADDDTLGKDLLCKREKVESEYLEKLKTRVEKTIQGLIKKSQDNECDIFQIKNSLYKFKYKQYLLYKDTPLNQFDFIVNVNTYSQD